jgi:hypothetical protein
MGGEYVHVADFAGAFAEAGESAKDTALVAFGIETQSLGSGFKAAGVGAQVVDLVGSGAFGGLFY